MWHYYCFITPKFIGTVVDKSEAESVNQTARKAFDLVETLDASIIRASIIRASIIRASIIRAGGWNGLPIAAGTAE